MVFPSSYPLDDDLSDRYILNNRDLTWVLTWAWEGFWSTNVSLGQLHTLWVKGLPSWKFAVRNWSWDVRKVLQAKATGVIFGLSTSFDLLTLSLPDDVVCEVVLTFASVDKTLWCDHSNDISMEVLSCGVICGKKIYKMKFVEFAFGHVW